MSQPNVRVSPEDLQAFAQRIESQMAPHLDRLQQLHSQVRGIESDLFTSVTFILSTAYVAATEYTGEDIKSKHDDLYDVSGLVRQTAQRWADAEHTNTIKGR